MPVSSPIPPLVGMIGRKVDHPPGTLVALYVRESGMGKRFTAQEKALLDYCKARGLRVLKIFRESATGTSLDPKDRPVLMEAIRFAKRHGVVIVAHDLSRFVRNPDEDAKRRKREGDGYDYEADLRFQALTADTVATFNRFVEAAGVRFATKCPPQVHDGKLKNGLPGFRSAQTLRGLRRSPKKSGRKIGERKNTPEERKAMVALRKAGATLGGIASHFGVAVNTVRRCLREQSRKWGQRFAVPLQSAVEDVWATCNQTVVSISYLVLPSLPQREIEAQATFQAVIYPVPFPQLE